MSTLFAFWLMLVIWGVAAAVYFTPTIVALVRKHKDWLPITLLNAFAGWTFVGWIVALVWSVKD